MLSNLILNFLFIYFASIGIATASSDFLSFYERDKYSVYISLPTQKYEVAPHPTNPEKGIGIKPVPYTPHTIVLRFIPSQNSLNVIMPKTFPKDVCNGVICWAKNEKWKYKSALGVMPLPFERSSDGKEYVSIMDDSPETLHKKLQGGLVIIENMRKKYGGIT